VPLGPVVILDMGSARPDFFGELSDHFKFFKNFLNVGHLTGETSIIPPPWIEARLTQVNRCSTLVLLRVHFHNPLNVDFSGFVQNDHLGD
ncbi:MAG TPA: hypothetical protein DEB59_09745, partial [Acidimicrobiaceae bacterium]|nr:hypothetical protein [Acidimicrobiaceae bacterium]